MQFFQFHPLLSMSAPPRDVELVQRWLRDLVGLPPAVSRRFHDEAVDVEALVEFSSCELTNLGVSKMGWQKKLLRRAREELQARSSTSSKRDLQRQSTSDPRQVMSSLLLSPIDPASRTYCDQSWEVTEVIDEAGLSHGLAEDEASQSAMAWHESPSGGSSPWQDCHKDGHGESVAGCNTANTGGSGADTDTADRMGDDGSDSGIAAPSNLEEQWEALEVGQRLWARSLLLPPLSHSLSLLLSVRPYAMNEDSNSHSNSADASMRGGAGAINWLLAGACRSPSEMPRSAPHGDDDLGDAAGGAVISVHGSSYSSPGIQRPRYSDSDTVRDTGEYLASVAANPPPAMLMICDEHETVTRTGCEGRDRDAAAARPSGASKGSLCLASDVSTGEGAEAAGRPPQEPASVALEPTKEAGSSLESARPWHSPHRAPVEGTRGGGAGKGKVTAQRRHGRGSNAGSVGGQNGSGETHEGVGLVVMDMDAVAAPSAGAGEEAGAPSSGGAEGWRDGVQLGECGREEMTQGTAEGLGLDSRIRELMSRGITDAQIVSKVKPRPERESERQTSPVTETPRHRARVPESLHCVL